MAKYKKYNSRQVRRFLKAAFPTGSALIELCQDCYPELLYSFGDGMSHRGMVNAIFNRCHNDKALEKLLNCAQEILEDEGKEDIWLAHAPFFFKERASLATPPKPDKRLEAKNGATNSPPLRPFKLQLSLRDKLEFEVRALETPMGEPRALSQCPYSADELVTILKALRLSKYDADRFNPQQIATLKQQGLLHNSLFVPDLSQRIGQALYKALMRGEVGRAFDVALTQARAARSTVSLQLRFDEDAVQLAQYPWELLHYRQALLSSRAVELTRYITYPQTATTLSVTPPLRLLYVQSRPSNLRELSAESEQTTVRQALHKLDNDLQVDVPLQPTFESLLDHLEEEPVHILHFDGHGIFARRCPKCEAMNRPHLLDCATCKQDIRHVQEQGYLAFEKATQDVDWISSETLGNLFYNRALRLVVLSACWSSRVRGDTLFGGTAAALIQTGVPALLSMQLPISVDIAVTFMQGFYRALARFESLPAAVNAGRSRIMRSREWFIPTLYLRSQDHEGHLYSKGTQSAVQR